MGQVWLKRGGKRAPINHRPQGTKTSVGMERNGGKAEDGREGVEGRRRSGRLCCLSLYILYIQRGP